MFNVGDLVVVTHLDIPKSGVPDCSEIVGRLGTVTFIESPPHVAYQLIVRMVGFTPSEDALSWLGSAKDPEELCLRTREVDLVLARFDIIQSYLDGC
jgi:hypothetical protein